MITVTSVTLADAVAFMEAAGYAPPREGGARAFAMTAAGDDVRMVTDGTTRVLVVLRHVPETDTSFVRVAVKQGPGDAMEVFRDACSQGSLFTFKHLATDAPVAKISDKLKAVLGAMSTTPGSVTWMAGQAPTEQVDV